MLLRGLLRKPTELALHLRDQRAVKRGNGDGSQALTEHLASHFQDVVQRITVAVRIEH